MKRIAELDALRGIAALAVVAFHVSQVGFPIGGTAVDLFFVLSGYLISTIILAQRSEPGFLWKFFVRRSLRIWPIYYLGIAATLLLCWIFSSPIDARGIPFALTYTQQTPSYFFEPSIEFSHAYRHTWTLAIEEQFYIIWPLALFFGGRKTLVPLASAFVIAAVVARGIGFAPFTLLTRADGLALGGLLAVLLGREAKVSRMRLSQVLGATLILAVGVRALGTVHPFGMNSYWALSLKMFSINLGYFALIGFVVQAAGGRATAWLRLPSLVWLGQISYGIYLYHFIVFHFVEDYGPASPLLANTLKVSLTFAIAALSWIYIEKPILSLKNRFDYQSKNSPAGSEKNGAIVTLPAPA